MKESDCFRSGKSSVSETQLSNCIFHHYAVEDLSLSQKNILHGKIAQCLIETFGDNVERVALDVARHFELSGEPERSIEYLILGGKSIMKVSQYDVAIEKFEKALFLLQKHPSENKEIQLDVLTMLSTCKRIVSGWANCEVIAVYKKALELARELGQVETVAAAQFGMWAVYMYQMHLSKALLYAQDYMVSALELNDKLTVIQANIALANTYFWMDKQDDALAALDAITRTNIDLADEATSSRFGQTPLSLVLMFRLICNYYKGDEAATQKALEDNISYLATVTHSYTKTIVLTNLSWYYYLKGENDQVLKYSEKLILITSEMNFKYYHGLGILFLCAGSRDGLSDQDWLDEMNKAEALVFDTSGLELFKIEFEISRARFYISRNLLAEAEEVLTLAEQRVNKSEEQVSKARICSILAEVFLLQGKIDEAKSTIEKGFAELNPAYTSSPVRLKLVELQKSLVENN